VADVLRRGSGAVLQRSVYAATGDLAAVVRAAVTATHADR
jgi:carboxylate-amine ligase